MIIPHREETELVIFRCSNCGNYFYGVGQGRGGCAVNHAPGECCHYSDAPISAEKVQKIMKEVKSDG